MEVLTDQSIFFLDRFNTLSVLLKVDNSFGSLFNGSRER